MAAKPEINFESADDLYKWLEEVNQPDWAVVLSTRAALRIFPIHSRANGGEPWEKYSQRCLLPVLRANTVAWHVAALGNDYEILSDADIAYTASKEVASKTTTQVAQLAVNAIAFAIFTIDTPVEPAVGVAADVANAAAIAVGGRAAALLWRVLSKDATRLADGMQPSKLAFLPLWHGVTPHAWVTRGWPALKTELLNLDQGWDVWTDWYDARLRGDNTVIPELERRRVLLEDEHPGIWGRKPDEINTILRQLIDEYEERRPTDEGLQDISQSKAETKGGLKEIRQGSNLSREELDKLLKRTPEASGKEVDTEQLDAKPAVELEGEAEQSAEETFEDQLSFGGTALSIATTVRKNAIDHLNVDDEANAFARLIAGSSMDHPLSIGVFGPWGSGKSFFMSRIQRGLNAFLPRKTFSQLEKRGATRTEVYDAEVEEDTTLTKNIVQIEFNAWHYMEANIWASLVDVIFKQLHDWLTMAAEDAPDREKEVEALFNQFATAHEAQIEALQAFGKRLDAKMLAEQDLKEAKKKYYQSGPETDAWFEILWNKLSRDQHQDVQEIREKLQLKTLGSKHEELRATLTLISKNCSNAQEIAMALKAQFHKPWPLLLIAGAIFLVPMGMVAWLSSENHDAVTGLSATIASTLTAITGGLGILARQTSRFMARMRELQASVQHLEETDSELVKKRRSHEEAAQKVALAKEQLQARAVALQDAKVALHEERAVEKIASFIRERAKGDLYEKHLGIIATIRKDFERLSDLFAQQRRGSTDDVQQRETVRLSMQAELEKVRHAYDHLDDDYKTELKKEIQKITDSLDEKLPASTEVDRIVLYIDDLDRCPPEKVYEVLQAIHLFLNFDLFVVIVGVDTRWMMTSLNLELGDLVDGQNGASTTDYLEKIFQIPYWVRPMDQQGARNFVTGMMGQISPEEEVPVPVRPDEQAEPEESNEKDGEDLTMEPTEAELRSLPADVNETSTRVESTDEDFDFEDETDEEGEPDDEAAQSEPESSLKPDLSDPIFQPVVLSGPEKDFMAEIARHAGNSPRQLQRFVNVYGLIKSGLGENLYEDVQRFALLTQIAIATAGGAGAYLWFEFVRYQRLLTEAALPEEKASAIATSVPDLQEKFGNFELRAVQIDEGERNQVQQAIALFHNKQKTGDALNAIFETSEIACRYTFLAAPEENSHVDSNKEGRLQ